MRSFQEFKVKTLPMKNDVPMFTVSCVVTQDDKMWDFTGENAIIFPQCLANLNYTNSRFLVERMFHLYMDLLAHQEGELAAAKSNDQFDFLTE